MTLDNGATELQRFVYCPFFWIEQLAQFLLRVPQYPAVEEHMIEVMCGVQFSARSNCYRSYV